MEKGNINWADARIGDSALVTSENKMGVILKDYGRKFHLRFADGSEKTYDASELNFFNTDDDYKRGGSIKKGDFYQWNTVEYDSKKGNNYKVVKNIEITDIDSKGQVIGRVVGTSNQFIIRDPQKNLKSKVSKMETGGDIERGGAHMYIELKDSDIVVYHGDAFKIYKNAKPMFVISSAKKGSWGELWQSIRSIQSSNTDGQKGSAHLYVKLSNGDITVYHGDNVRQFRKLDEDERLFLQKNVRKHSWDRVYNTLMNLKSVKMENGGMAGKTHFQPVIRKDKNNPNFLYIDIYYPEGKGIISIGQSKTMFGREREEGALKALQIANSFAKQLEAKYNIEDIEVNDLKNGKVQVFAVSDDFVKMRDNLLNNIKMENGGIVGQEIVFDDSGERNTGVIKEIHEITGNYIVATDDGRTVLAQKDMDVISLGKMRTKSGEGKRRFSFFEDGGNIAKENKEMIDSQTIEARHHVEELSKILTKKNKIEPWVVARMERATTDLSDVTHYLEGKKMAKGGRAGDYPSFKVTKIIRVDDEMITPGYYTYTGKERGGKGVYMNGQNYQTAGFDLDKIKRLKSLFPDSIEMVMETGGGVDGVKKYEIIDSNSSKESLNNILDAIHLVNSKGLDLKIIDKTGHYAGGYNHINSVYVNSSMDFSDLVRKFNDILYSNDIHYISIIGVYAKGGSMYDDGGGVDDSKNKKIMESYREWVFDLRNQSYPKMSVSQAIKQATEYMYSYYSKEELIEAIKNDRQIEMFGMENTWLNALKRAKKRKMAKGGGVGSKLKATYIPNRNIDELKTVFGQSIKGKDLIDGAYTTRKGIKQKPKMARTMFEEQTFEFSKGGVISKVYLLTGMYGAKGIPGKVLFAFKKEIEKHNFEGGVNSMLSNINDLWSKWSINEGVEIIKNEVFKKVEKKYILYIIASLDKVKWEPDTVNKINREGSNELYIRIPSDFVIDIGFYDDVDSNRFAKKLGGYNNTAIVYNQTEVFGNYQNVGYNNIEIRESLFILIKSENKKMAHGGMTEHGLRRGDTIVYNQADEVMVIDKKNNQHLINLDKGERYNQGGKMSTGGAVEKNGVNQFAEDEKSEGYEAKVYLGKFDGRTFKAEYTNKTWFDGTPVTKYFSRNGLKNITLKGKYQLVDSDRGYWYIQGPRNVWYAVRQKDYGTPPFEFGKGGMMPGWKHKAKK